MTATNNLLTRLREYDGRPLRIMEVCGTHTAAIAKSGIRSVISDKIKLLSGPGCPVCVTPAGYIDSLCDRALNNGSVILSFGDMLRVPGLNGSLNDARAQGADVRMVYSPFDALTLAQKEAGREFIFAAVGFETIAPVYALLVEQARDLNIKNLKLMTALKTMPAVLELMCREGIDAFLAPGHVAAVTGSNYFLPISEKHSKPFCVAGFSGNDVIGGIYDLLCQLQAGSCEVHNLYSSVVTPHGNPQAMAAIERVFTPCDALWRGIGNVPMSGLRLKDELADFALTCQEYADVSLNGCRCGDVICGRINPDECPLFGGVCTPRHPNGPCMVSQEGACGVWYENNI